VTTTSPAALPPQQPIKRVSIMDPITARQYGVDIVPNDHIVDLSTPQKMGISVYEATVATPRSVVRGLSGDPKFSMSDFARLTKIPYYLGGAFLTLSFAAGGDKATALRQGLGCLLYYAGFAASNKGVNALYKSRYGVDLDLTYKTPLGNTEKVFDSLSFPRFDLLRPQDYAAMRKKMAIPDTVASPDHEVRQQLTHILPTAWVNKMVVGNLLAALGAGYLSRQSFWLRWADNTPFQVLREPGNKLRRLGITLQQSVKPVLAESKTVNRVALGAMAAGLAYSVLTAVTAQKPKQYQAPFTSTVNMAARPVQRHAFQTFDAGNQA
jgi:hypothetical protein